MHFLRINEAKLKITLTAEECEKYDIRDKGGEFDAATVRAAITAILSEPIEVDFPIDGEKLLVQLYPMKEGGAEIFITKLSSVGERERRIIGKSDNLNTYHKARAYFRFEALADLIQAARAAAGREIPSDLYRKEDGEYILAVVEENVDGISNADIFLEYSTRLPPGSMAAPLEWYTLLYEGNALSVLREAAL